MIIIAKRDKDDKNPPTAKDLEPPSDEGDIWRYSTSALIAEYWSKLPRVEQERITKFALDHHCDPRSVLEICCKLPPSNDVAAILRSGYYELLQSIFSTEHPNRWISLVYTKGLSGAFVFRASMEESTLTEGLPKGLYVFKLDSLVRGKRELSIRVKLADAAKKVGKMEDSAKREEFLREVIPGVKPFPDENGVKGNIALIYELAPGRPVSDYTDANDLRKAFLMTSGLLLRFSQLFSETNLQVMTDKTCVQVMNSWCGNLFESQLQLQLFLENDCFAKSEGELVDAGECSSFKVNDLDIGPLPNPLVYLQSGGCSARRMPVVWGLVHGDLNTNNVMIDFDKLGRCKSRSLIDLGGLELERPLMLDQAFFELWYLLNGTGSLTEEQVLRLCHALHSDQSAGLDVPSEGFYQTMRAGRKAIENWVKDEKRNSHYVEILRDQWKLASVAAGLNYCNHPGDPKKRFLAYLWAAESLSIHLGKHRLEGQGAGGLGESLREGKTMKLESPLQLEIKRLSVVKDRYQPPSLPLIKASMDYNQIVNGNNLPLVVLRQHLAEDFWQGKDFHELLLFNLEGCSIHKEAFGSERPIVRLNMDISGAEVGIFNNNGKDFLDERFPSEQKWEEANQEIYNFICRKEDGDLDLWKVYPDGVPLRWASAGYLPIVRTRDGEWWAMLFFRDRFPIGWNVANGGSESEVECADISKLIGREFAEESVLLDRTPPSAEKIKADRDSGQYSVVGQYKFFDVRGEGDKEVKAASRWAHSHERLRGIEDRMTLKKEGLRKDVEPVRPTDKAKPVPQFQVWVTDNRSRVGGQFRERDVIFSINVKEFGVEAIYLCTFDLCDADYFIDGEVGDAGSSIIRRPVGLFNTRFLRDVFAVHNGNWAGLEDPPAEWHPSALRTGVDRVSKNPFEGCKVISRTIPAGSYKAFGWDIDRRLNTVKDKDNVRAWLENLKSGGDLSKSPLTSLCPVTWKTLDIAFKFDMIPIGSGKEVEMNCPDAQLDAIKAEDGHV